jgi:predicted nucleic acid-binding protein
MAVLVLDSSVAGSWCFRDETTDQTAAVLDLVAADGAAVPNLWHLEIANVLLAAERRGRITSADVDIQIGVLAKLPLDLDSATAHAAAGDILALARAHRLTTYDAAYLELALRRRLPLATLDKTLRGAAGRAGVAVLPA